MRVLKPSMTKRVLETFCKPLKISCLEKLMNKQRHGSDWVYPTVFRKIAGTSLFYHRMKVSPGMLPTQSKANLA